MLLQSILFAISSASLVFFASAQTGGPTNGAELPVHWGVLIFPGFDHLDVFGPVEYLSMIGLHNPTKFYLIAPSMDPVTSRIPPTVVLPPAMKGEGIEVKILPTHTLDNAPPLDILLVPGGPGSRVEVNNTAIPGFIKNRYPTLKYLLSVCTGSALLAKAGVLDGRKATSNKAAFTWASSMGPKVDWVTHARWVEDGNIWTSSGVSAGMDMMFNFTERIYGLEMANHTANSMEHIVVKDSKVDPFADWFNVTLPPRP